MFTIIILLIFLIFILLYMNSFDSFQLINSNKYKNIHVWQGERYDNVLHFMYKPVVLSIINILQEQYNDIIIDYKINYYNFDEILENDILIWVGCDNIPDFNALKKKKYLYYLL